MSKTKNIFRWGVGIVAGIYLAILLAFNIPFTQRWIGNAVESLLGKQLGTRIEIGRIDVYWNGRIIIDDLMIEDRQGETMLQVARMGARVGFRELLSNRIRIGNAQLFGAHANLYQQHPDSLPNFQFIIDALSSKDTTEHKPLDLRISQILVRRGNVQWEQRWKERKKGFDPAHLRLSNLNVTAQMDALTDDSIDVRVKRFDVKEASGLQVHGLTFTLKSGKHGTFLSDLHLSLPATSLTGDVYMSRGLQNLGNPETLSGRLNLQGKFATDDLQPFFAQAKSLDLSGKQQLEMSWTGYNAHVSSLQIADNQGTLALNASGNLRNINKGKKGMAADMDIHHAHADNAFITNFVKNPILANLGFVNLSGHLEWLDQTIRGNADLTSLPGSLSLQGEGSTDGHINANIVTDGFNLGKLLSSKQNGLGNVALDMNVKGEISKRPNLALQGVVKEINYNDYRYRNISLDGQLNDKCYTGKVNIKDANIGLDAEGKVDIASSTLKMDAELSNFSPNMLNLTDKYPNTHFSGKVEANLQGHNLSDIVGTLHLNDLCMADSSGNYRPGDIHITARHDEKQSQILLISPFLEAQIDGRFEPKALAEQVKYMLSNYLPTVKSNIEDLKDNTDYGSLTLRLYSAEPLRRLLNLPLTISAPVTAHGEINVGSSALWLTLKAPDVQYGNENMRNIDFHLESNYEALLATIEVKRQMKGKWVNFGMETNGHDQRLTTRLYWNNNADVHTSTYAGDISIISRLWQDPSGKQGFEGTILPSNLIVSDTVWTVHPGFVRYYDNVLQVDSFQISKGERFISIDGRASKDKNDVLHARLKEINLEYIFSLINFHAVELTGCATGDVYARTLFSEPYADGYINIPDFALNYGELGDLDIHINWGKRPYSIYLNGDIKDSLHLGRTLVEGYITPKKDIDYHGLELNVDANRVNLYFINKWTSGIFDDLEGRATGHVRIFGPFKQLNIEGDALVNEGSVGIPFIGVRYHLVNDSVKLRPNNIYFTNARLYDPMGNPGVNGHSAQVSGHLQHDHFSNMRYDIAIHGENILGYDFKDFADMNFYGTVYATGDVTLRGYPGNVHIGIKAHPLRGTTFTYNVTTPDKLTSTPFISYINRRQQLLETDESDKEKGKGEEEQIAGDLRIDFDLDLDNQSTMNLLMDMRSGDMITINGHGRMLAHYYNKGAFELFGTYRVDRGTYNLSLQEFIHKNFDFSSDGTITFNGEPYDADLNLQAVHTVSGVSLNDINAKANFSNTSARVNCLMNIGGKARAPQVTFDFDIQNVNEEEKQMVRSLISTEEERNMQVIYLLGIGRFYAYDYANSNQTQGSTAMNSLLSSTLSGTINQALSNMFGSTNWNFGTNLKTGEMGWSDMDVEGMLQGSLLNNRLLINGNFGYRDNPVANSNFIGDFDVKYLLTRSGSVALKAYSETNDRYFTKSSLTTQGIGIMLKKDFSTWKELMKLNGNKRRKTQSTSGHGEGNQENATVSKEE